MILIDSNVIIDVINNEAEWKDWSMGQIAHLCARDHVAVNEIVVAEVAPSMGSLEVFHEEIGKLGIVVESLSDRAAFTAGAAFRSYRMTRHIAGKAILADFFIGGHAEVLGAAILTRDPRFYRTYFPSVPLITPKKDEND